MAIEKQLFDANEFLSRLQNVVYDVCEPSEGFGYSVGLIKTVLKQIKPVDAVEVVHGRWERQKYYGGIRKGMVERIICSECGYPNNKTNYCPNCGAKMDGDEK